MWLFLWDSEPSKIFVGDTPISKVFLWDTQVRPSWWGWWPTYTYDFTVSDNWFSYTWDGWIQGWESWQWFYLRSRSTLEVYSLVVTPPQSIFDNKTIKRIRISFYLPSNNTAAGINGLRYQAEYNYPQYYGTSNWYNVIVWEHTGEIYTDTNFEPNRIYGDVAWTTFDYTGTLPVDAISQRSNKSLTFVLVNWYVVKNTYLRKIEIWTE